MINDITILSKSINNIDEILELSRDKQWTMKQCLEILLAYGIGYIHIKDILSKESEDTDEKVDNIVKEYIRNEGRYSSYKFRNFQLFKDNRILNFRITGYSFENQNLKASIKSMTEGE